MDKKANQKLWFVQKVSSSCFDKLNFVSTLLHYNDFNMIEGMEAIDHLHFCARKIAQDHLLSNRDSKPSS